MATKWSDEVYKLMSVKNELLKLLEANRDKDLSGEQIARRLRVTRAAVWKAVQALQNDGYEITAKNRLGYRLAPPCDRLSPEGVGLFFKNNIPAIWTFKL